MCVFKVANSRNYGKGDRVHEGGRMVAEMPVFSGHSREIETSVMVFALTRVVSGEVTDQDLVNQSVVTGGGDGGSSSSSASMRGVGEKRGREEEDSGISFSESFGRVSTARTGDFSVGSSLSSLKGEFS